MSLASIHRRLASIGQYGHQRTPDRFYMGEGYCEYHWSNARLAGIADHATWIRVARLSARYLRFVDYCREIAPQWQEVERVHYADNSIEAVQRAADGRERTVTLVYPNGDVCF